MVDSWYMLLSLKVFLLDYGLWMWNIPNNIHFFRISHIIEHILHEIHPFFIQFAATHRMIWRVTPQMAPHLTSHGRLKNVTLQLISSFSTKKWLQVVTTGIGQSGLLTRWTSLFFTFLLIYFSGCCCGSNNKN